MSIKSIADNTAKYLAKETGKNKNILSYGIEIIIEVFIKIFLIIIISYYLGIFKTTMTTFLFASILRLSSGGAHCSSYRRCLISGLFIFLILGYVNSAIYTLNNFIFNFIYFLATSIFIFTVIYKWVPTGNEHRQINDNKRRQKFKIYSLLITFLSLIFILFSYISSYRLFAISALTGLLWQCISVTPFGYKFLNFLEQQLIRIKL